MVRTDLLDSTPTAIRSAATPQGGIASVLRPEEDAVTLERFGEGVKALGANDGDSRARVGEADR